MNTNRITALLLSLMLLLSLAVTAEAAEVESGSVYCFSPEDFAMEENLAGICITDLPEGDVGSILLGTRLLREGDILTAEQLAQMTFCPVGTETDRSAQVGYLPIYQDHVAAGAAMTIGIRGKTEQPPIAEDQTLETYKNLPGTGKLKVSDPEGQSLTFTVTRSPKRGEVTVSEDGSFTYTPRKNKVGVDSFTYTAADPAGKVSREATVTITILKPADSAQYTDTVGCDCRFAAEWMRHTGIFAGETVAENPCFSPEKSVTRGEFVTMLVKTLDIPVEEELEHTGYTDEIPQWLQPYLTAAVRSGLTAGLPDQTVFGADEVLTGGEAAVMLQNALDISVPAGTGDGSWADAALAALAEAGICLEQEAPMTRSITAQALYQASRLTTAE